jgi:hypothetical protein
MRRLLSASALLAAVTGLAALAVPASATSATTTTSPIQASGNHNSTVVASATWGVSNGKSFVRVTKGVVVGQYRPNAVAASGSCTETISNVTRSGGFYWSTSQLCSGYFGAQDMKTQMWRSSWSGPRGYGSWAYYPSSGLLSQSYIQRYWTIACNNGKGYYNYYPVMQGYASSLGSGPVIRSGNQLNNQDCGPYPP